MRSGSRSIRHYRWCVLSQPLARAIDDLRTAFPAPRGLLADLPADAVFAWATTGELVPAVSRLLELLARNQLGDRHGYEAFDLLDAGGWQGWEAARVAAICRLADAWWLTALVDHPGDVRAADRLGELCHLGLPMVRWLSVWMDHFDGAGALHLADLVLEGSGHPAWIGYDDLYGQVEAWTRSEPVVMGLTLVGGVHVGRRRLGSVLDRIVVTPGLA